MHKWTHNVQGINSFNSYQVVTYRHNIHFQHSMVARCEKYSPLHDKFWLAMQISEVMNRTKRATNIDEPCSTNGDSISNYLCNFREIAINSCPNVHMTCKCFQIGITVWVVGDYSKPTVNKLQLTQKKPPCPNYTWEVAHSGPMSENFRSTLSSNIILILSLNYHKTLAIWYGISA